MKPHHTKWTMDGTTVFMATSSKALVPKLFCPISNLSKHRYHRDSHQVGYGSVTVRTAARSWGSGALACDSFSMYYTACRRH